jgi:hypothetical protein
MPKHEKSSCGFIYLLWLGVAVIVILAGFILPNCAHGDTLANDATLKVYFTYPGEDCPDGGTVASMTIRYSLSVPSDTSHFAATCPTLPTTQDNNNAVYIAGMTVLATLVGKTPGTTDSLTITGLPYDTPVWVEADAKDEVNNKSATWIVQSRTGIAPDVTAPEPVKIRFFR